MKNIIIYFSVLLLFLFVGCSSENARFEEGLAAYERGDYETALQEFKPLAEKGHAGAQFNLGVMYDEGHGVPKDYVEAFKSYKKAAEQGHGKAQHNLGFMYFMGKGVTQDYVEAFKWFKKAAEKGYAMAQHILGYMYFMGKGVTQDYVMANMWYNLAAAQGIEAVVVNRGTLEEQMTPEQIVEAQRLSREFKVKSP